MSFRFQILLITAMLVALSVMASGLRLMVDQEERLQRDLQTRYTAATQQLAVASADPLSDASPDRLEALLLRAAGEWPEAQDLSVLDRSGRTLAHVTLQAGKSPRRDYGAAKIPKGVPQRPQAVMNAAQAGGQEVLQFWSPVGAGPVSGWVYAEVSTLSLASARHELLMSTTVLALVASVMAAFIMHLFMLRPLRALEAAREFTLRLRQEPGVRLPVSPGPAEFEALHRALDAVSVHLERQRQGLSESLASDPHLRQKTRGDENGAGKPLRFLAHLSHEMRTPLNAVIGLTYLTLQTALQDRQRRHLTQVHRSAQNLLVTLNDILDFSRVQAGQLVLDMQPFQVDELLQDVAEILSFRAEDQGLEFLIDRGPEVPKGVVGDRLRLQQMLVNLGSHAIQVTPAGEVLVRVHAQERPDGQVTLRFEVKDKRIGRPSEPMSPPVQSDDPREASPHHDDGDPGLGWALSQSLVTLMGGELIVQPVEEPYKHSGAVVVITLPMRLPSPEELHALGRGMDQLVDPQQLDLRGRRCLIVDDSATALEISSRMLSQLGLRVDAAPSAIDALMLIDAARTSGTPYDLVLLDWRMPHLDGLTAAARIAQRCGELRPLLVLTTAFGAEEARTQAHDHGVHLDGVLPKPATPTQLSRLLASLFLEPSSKPLTAPMAPPQGSDGQVPGLSGRRASPPAPEFGEPRPAGALTGLRLLVVEDSEVNQEVARALLEMHGAEVVLVADGHKAVNLLNAMANRGDPLFDAVLMDCQMPFMDGYEATRVLRAQQRFAHLPIIAITAQAMEPEVQAMQEAGMDAYVPKPFVVDDLLETVLRQTSSSPRHRH